MLFKRELTPTEIKALGTDPIRKVHEIISAALNRMMNVNKSTSVEARILSLLTTDKPMNARSITDAHNALFGHTSIKINYTRFVLSGMHSAGMIKRAGRGAYVKG